jgi:hypothetical protein
MKYKRPYMQVLAAINALPAGVDGAGNEIPVYTVADGALTDALVTPDNSLWLPLAVIDTLLDAEAEILTEKLKSVGHHDRAGAPQVDPTLGKFLFKQDFTGAQGELLAPHIGSPVGIEIQQFAFGPYLAARPGRWERVSRFAAGVNHLNLTTIKGLYALDDHARFFFVGVAARVWMVNFTRPATPEDLTQLRTLLVQECLLPDRDDAALVERTVAALQAREGEQLQAGAYWHGRSSATLARLVAVPPVPALVEGQRKGAI